MPNNKIEGKPEKPVDGKDFAEKYQKLCEETGYRIVVIPQYMARDDGTFSLILSYQTGLMPQK